MSTSNASATTAMRAITTPAWGSAEDALVLRDVPRPTPGPAEILVEVHAAGVNPVDTKSRAAGGFGLWHQVPIVGWDVSGVVVEKGPGVAHLDVGDEVFGMPRFPHQAGAYAEYVAAPSRHFARKPASLSHEQAAALPLAGLTAWQALVDAAHLAPLSDVVVLGAAGGVGHFAVQIAKARGATVHGTASAGKHVWLRELGVDHPIDYHGDQLSRALPAVDLVLDTVGGEAALEAIPRIREGGRLITLPGPDALFGAVGEAARAAGIQADFLLVEPDGHALTELAALVEAGHLRPHVEQSFPLEQAAAAHRASEAGRTSGKLVLTVR